VPMTGWLDPVMPAIEVVAGGVDKALGTFTGTDVLTFTGAETKMGEMTIPGKKREVSVKSAVDMLIGGGEGAEVRKPLAITIISGLALSTLLTLIVIPTIWAWISGLRGRAKIVREDET
jgi:hypothetical protein